MAQIKISKDNNELTFKSLNEVITKHFKLDYGMNAQAAQRYILNKGYELVVDGVIITNDNVKSSTAPSKTATSIIERVLKELSSVDNALVKKLQEELNNKAMQIKTMADVESLQATQKALAEAMNPPTATLDAVVSYIVNLYHDHTTKAPEATASATA